jgi:GTPase SAR1 family protein
MSQPAVTSGTKPNPNTFSIHLGVYGCSRAGKTRFLYQLLSLYQQQNRLLNISETGKSFLSTVETELKEHSKTLPTTAITEGIEVEVRRDPRFANWKLKVRDLKGEDVADQLDRLGNLIKTDLIPMQVRQCDAFIFFFDPSCSEQPDEIDAHHRRESQRAKLFIDYVLKQRENRHLPIVFVATHLDLWENDEGIRLRADHWFSEVRQSLQGQYRKHLLNHFPPRLLNPDWTEIRVSSVRGLEVEKVIERISDLTEDCRRFAGDDRQIGKRVLSAGVAMLSLIGLLLLGIFVFDKAALQVPGPLKNVPDRNTINDWDETTLKARLAEARSVLDQLNTNPSLPNPTDAKRLNLHLRWMMQRLENLGTLSSGTKAILERTLQESAVYLNTIIALPNNPVLDLVSRLTTILEEVPDASTLVPDLGKVQTAFWSQCRLEVVSTLSKIVERRNASGSKPEDLFAEITQELRRFEQELPSRRVFGGLAKSELVQELKLTQTFTDDRQLSRSYPATVRILSAQFAPASPQDTAFRSITIQSPGIDPFDIGLKPEIATSGPLTFSTKRNLYPLNIGIGTPITAQLMLQESADRWQKVQEFDLTQGLDAGAKLLALPLLSTDGTEKKLKLQAGGYEIELELTGLTRIPKLLMDGVANK